LKKGAIFVGKIRRLFFVLFLVFICSTEANASFVSEEDALNAVKTWLKKNPAPMETQIGNSVKEIRHYHGEESGEPGYYVVFLNPKGWVILPAEDTFEPILAFGGEKLTPERYENSPLYYMLHVDISQQDISTKMVKLNLKSNSKESTELENRWNILRSIVFIL
jgi:hypothetical protein